MFYSFDEWLITTFTSQQKSHESEKRRTNTERKKWKENPSASIMYVHEQRFSLSFARKLYEKFHHLITPGWVVWSQHDDFSIVYYNKLYYDKSCPASMMEGRGRRQAFGSHL
jgi:hypothetical protein